MRSRFEVAFGFNGNLRKKVHADENFSSFWHENAVVSRDGVLQECTISLGASGALANEHEKVRGKLS